MRPTRSPASAHRYLPLVVALVAATAAACGHPGPPGPKPPSPVSSTGEPTTPARAGTATPTATPPAPPEPAPPTGSIPSELVGEWCGGSNSAPGGHYTWTFYPDGTFDASNSRQAFGGTAVLVNPRTLTIYPTTGEPLSMSIAMDETMIGPMLYLNDYSYVRGGC
jgi:hypothetical protein